MHSNRYWIFFLISVAAITFGFCGNAAWQLYRFWAHDATVTTTSIQWRVESKIGDRYYLVGDYTFEVEGKSFTGQTLLEKPLFRNLWSANQAIEDIGDASRPVYFASKNPILNTLDLHFPLKEALSAAALLGLMLYFLGLGYYVALQKRR